MTTFSDAFGQSVSCSYSFSSTRILRSRSASLAFPSRSACYKVGDFINAGGTLGTVKELGLFATTVETVDGV